MPRIARSVAAVVMVLAASTSLAAEAKIGLGLRVEAESFSLDPQVSRILVTSVEPHSLAAEAGIAKGDEIVSVQGQTVKGRRASELKPYIGFHAGETRTFGVRHASGEVFDATITKPKE